MPRGRDRHSDLHFQPSPILIPVKRPGAMGLGSRLDTGDSAVDVRKGQSPKLALSQTQLLYQTPWFGRRGIKKHRGPQGFTF